MNLDFPLPEPPSPEHVAARRADVEAKQEQVADVLESMGCEAALLLSPPLVAWFTSGLTTRGLVAETERPGVFTNGRQRWLVCSNVDTQRLFDEEIDQLGFQLKEWSWDAGRAELLMNIVAGRKVATDRPYPHMPLIVEPLRPLVRVLSAFERQAMTRLGETLAHALEATARSLKPGDTEEQAAGLLGHRLLHHGAEPVAVGVTADARSRNYRRAGFTAAPIREACTLQATAQKEGLYVTASRSVAFGPLADALRAEFEQAVLVSAVQRSLSRPGETVGSAVLATTRLLAGNDFEFEGRLSPPAHGTGRAPADELRRAGRDEAFVEHQALVWQARLGRAAIVDTVFITPVGPVPVTPPQDWPFKRIRLADRTYDVPDLLVK